MNERRLALICCSAIGIVACTTLPAVPTALTGTGGSADGLGGGAGTTVPPGGTGGHAGASGVDAGSGGAGGVAGASAAGGNTGSGTGGSTSGSGGSVDAGTGGALGTGGAPATVISFSSTPVVFQYPGATTGALNPSIALGDIDGDHRIDLAILNASEIGGTPISILIFLNNASGATGRFFASTPAATFQYSGVNANTNSTSIALGDIDGDGKVDMALRVAAAAGNAPFNVLYFLNNGSGAAGRFFGAAPAATSTFPQTATSLSSPSIALGDVDGDGKVDLQALTTPQAGGTALSVSTYLNNGSGVAGKFFASTAAAISTFTGVTNGGAVFSSLSLGDINGDGRLDVAPFDAPLNTAVNVPLFLNNGSGLAGKFFATQPAFTLPAAAIATGSRSWVALGDIDGDGKADLAILNVPANGDTLLSVYIYLNTSH